jgi:subfamily B ATP-binding cassette protein MsbA
MSPTRIFVRLVQDCLQFPGRLLAIFASLLGLAAAQLYLTWLVKLWTEQAVGSADPAVLRSLLNRAAVTTAVTVVAVFASRYLLNSVNQRMIEGHREAIDRRLLQMPVSAVRERRSGEWLSRVFNDTGALAGFVRDILKRLVGEGIVLIGSIAMMFYLRWELAAIACLLVPLVALLLTRLGERIRSRGAVAQRAVGDLSALLNEQLQGLTTIKDFQTENFEHRRFAGQNTRYRRAVMHSEWWIAMLMTAVWLITGMGLLGIIWYGTRYALAGWLTAGGLFAFCLYAVQTIEPLRRLAEVQGMLQRALAAAERVYDVIDAPEVEQEGLSRLSDAVRGEVRLEGVGFWYREDEAVLNGFDLRIAARETVAVVAASGHGKSTLASLLVRFADPQRGRILLDGIDVRAVRLADLRRAVCVVEQTPFIFSGPLIDNIRYGSWQASRAAVEAAVGLAGLESLVASIGLDARLEEGGRDLSGGQKQRIALARAIVRDPAVLVLDEATSALDSDTEAHIFAQLEPWLRRRTAIVMAHRLATISRFGRVVVLQGGRVVGDGSVAALLQRCPAFSQLFAEQLTPLGPGDVARIALRATARRFDTQ